MILSTERAVSLAINMSRAKKKEKSVGDQAKAGVPYSEVCLRVYDLRHLITATKFTFDQLIMTNSSP